MVKRLPILSLLSVGLSVGMSSLITADSSVPKTGVSKTLDILTIQLQKQLRRAGDSIHKHHEKAQGRCVAKVENFRSTIAKEDHLPEKFDAECDATHGGIHDQFNHASVQLSGIVSNPKERARVKKQLEALEKKVNTKVARLSGKMKSHASKVLQRISKEAERLSDQVASALDVAKDRGNKAEQVAVSTEEAEQTLPVCGVANNDEATPIQEGSAS